MLQYTYIPIIFVTTLHKKAINKSKVIYDGKRFFSYFSGGEGPDVKVVYGTVFLIAYNTTVEGLQIYIITTQIENKLRNGSKIRRNVVNNVIQIINNHPSEHYSVTNIQVNTVLNFVCVFFHAKNNIKTQYYDVLCPYKVVGQLQVLIR